MKLSLSVVVVSLFFLLSAVATLSMAEIPKVTEVVKTLASTSDKQLKDEDVPVNVEPLETQDLEELSNSTQITLDEKKKDVSKAVIEGQKALVEKETIQNKVEKLEDELEKTKTKIKETENQKSKTDVNQLKQKSSQLEEEYQALKNELKIKTEKAKKAFKKSSKQQNDITRLKEQLHYLEIEKKQTIYAKKESFFHFSHHNNNDYNLIFER